MIELLETDQKYSPERRRVAFDRSYRPRGWPGKITARKAFEAIFAYVDLALPKFEDENILYVDADTETFSLRLKAAGVQEIAVKCGADGALFFPMEPSAWSPHSQASTRLISPPLEVRSNAAYLAARIKRSPLLGKRPAWAIALPRPSFFIPVPSFPARLGHRTQPIIELCRTQ